MKDILTEFDEKFPTFGIGTQISRTKALSFLLSALTSQREAVKEFVKNQPGVDIGEGTVVISRTMLLLFLNTLE